MNSISQNLAMVRERIRAACAKAGRDAAEVRLIAVTKGRTLEQIRQAVDCGITELGENRVQEAREKIAHFAIGGGLRQAIGAARPNPRWHLIGRLQTNKAKAAVELFDCIHSLDSPRLAAALNAAAEKTRKPIDVLLQVNVSGEASKTGFAPDELRRALPELAQLPHLKLCGLMTMAPFTADPEQTRPVFRTLRLLRDELVWAGYPALRELSMGMSQDYAVAVEEGATLTRIGGAIFAD